MSVFITNNTLTIEFTACLQFRAFIDTLTETAKSKDDMSFSACCACNLFMKRFINTTSYRKSTVTMCCIGCQIAMEHDIFLHSIRCSPMKSWLRGKAPLSK